MLDLSPFVAAFVLSVEAQTWTFQGNKERVVREHLDVNWVRYSQVLNQLIDSELGLRLDSVTTNRLRRVRELRRLRSVRRTA